ncbi:MAG: peptidylprolyl isomerase [Gammaproteobacteria bacterium]
MHLHSRLFKACLAVTLVVLTAPAQAQGGVDFSPPAQGSVSAQTLDGIVAVVDDDVVLASELRKELRTIVDGLRAKGVGLPPRDVLTRQVLEKLILNRLQLALAERSGIKIDDERLNRAIEAIARRNNLTLVQFRDTIEREGFSYEDFREGVRDQMVIRSIRQRQVNNRVSVTDQEVETFLAAEAEKSGINTEYRLSQILVAVPSGANPGQAEEAFTKAKELVAQLRAGAEFSETAISESDSPDALEGGDLGWRTTAAIPRVLSAEVEWMTVGQVSDPIRSSSGYHIVKLQDKRSDQSRRLVDQFKARHILIKPSEIESAAQVRDRLSRLRQRVLGGDDFATLAQGNSDDSGTAGKGGQLDWSNPSDFVPQFSEAVQGLSPGQISEPFQTPFGWHIVQLQDRRRVDQTDEITREKAREALTKGKVEEETDLWLRKLRDEAYVEIRINLGSAS